MDESPTWLPDSQRFFQLLNTLPRTNDTFEWLTQFRVNLQELLDGVDRVSVFVDTSVSLTVEEKKWAAFFAETSALRTSFEEAVTRDLRGLYVTATQSEQDSYPETAGLRGMMAILYDKMKRDEPRVAEHYEPITFEYLTCTGKHMGGIFLWRHRSKSPIPESSIKLLDSLHNFILFALEDLLARIEFARPMLRGFFTSMVRLVQTAKLPEHEAEVAALLLLGRTYEQIAGDRKISVNTVRKYITNVYKKADVHSLNELYAAYFLPWSL